MSWHRVKFMISYFSDIAENCYEQAAIAQSVVRNIGSVEVTSSILVSSSKIKSFPVPNVLESFFVFQNFFIALENQ